jgi:hypothetical protein
MAWSTAQPDLHHAKIAAPGGLDVGPMSGHGMRQTTGVDEYRSLMGQAEKLFRCRRFRVPAFSACSFGT